MLTIAAARRAGLFYGAMSLWQLATPDAAKGPVAVPAASIEDAPRFAWRGLMVDSARHVQSLDTLKAVIDAMAVHKLNTFHWHLVDDQGWRLEIKKYPKLTEIGAWRTDPGAARAYPKYGGFYTQDQARELVAYAAARNITVVPEIETPGHALAPIVAYPSLGTAAPDASKMGDWGVFPWLYNTDDATFAFLDDVLNEVMDIFPSTFIHVGGDEAVKDQWKASPKIQAKIKELGLKDEHELQSWFIQRVGKSLNERGRRLIGWDEILEGGLAPNATVMSWRGIDGAIAAARQGHDTVLSPHPTLYLDNRQSQSPEEPTGRGHVSSLKDVYAFDPAPAQLTPDERKHILGVQANVWTEHMQTDTRMELMAFPRAVALAERGWSSEADANWDDFARRLPAEMTRLKILGVAANTVPFEPQAAPSEGAVLDHHAGPAGHPRQRPAEGLHREGGADHDRRRAGRLRQAADDVCRHLQPVLDLGRRQAGQGRGADRADHPDPVQLPGRQGPRQHSAPPAGHARRRAGGAVRLYGRAHRRHPAGRRRQESGPVDGHRPLAGPRGPGGLVPDLHLEDPRSLLGDRARDPEVPIRVPDRVAPRV